MSVFSTGLATHPLFLRLHHQYIHILCIRCKRVSRALRAGVVWENCSQCSPVEAPWGGIKKSGVGGRELGRWGLEEFLVVKAVTSCKGSFSYNAYGGAV